MNNRVEIGYRHLPGENGYKILVKDTYTYKVLMEAYTPKENLNSMILDLKNKYPDNIVCEYIY